MAFATVYEAGRGYERAINGAFQAASAALLALVQNELGLADVLAALKHYLLLARGDVLAMFLDLAATELAKPASALSVMRLQSLLDIGKSNVGPL